MILTCNKQSLRFYCLTIFITVWLVCRHWLKPLVHAIFPYIIQEEIMISSRKSPGISIEYLWLFWNSKWTILTVIMKYFIFWRLEVNLKKGKICKFFSCKIQPITDYEPQTMRGNGFCLYSFLFFLMNCSLTLDSVSLKFGHVFYLT